MGISTAPDIFQENMPLLFENYDFVRVYIDDLLIITKGSFEDHLEKLHLVFSVLSRNGLQIDPNKSKFCAWESEYLGFIISRKGIRPSPEKVKAIVELQPPTMRRHLRSFIGMFTAVQRHVATLRAHARSAYRVGVYESAFRLDA
jgi:cleavage and polyadenylation specificity factor subunit 1